MIKRFSAMLLCIAFLFNAGTAFADDTYKETGFTLIETKESSDLGGTLYYFSHTKTGAEVIYLDNQAERRDFSIGFKTPPTDNKGANHVLEHSLLCGSEKYPIPNIMHYVRGNALAESINAVTSDDCTYYEIKTPNETEYYNLIDVYMNGIFHPLLLTEENIFKQQGIRLEYADGKIQYNGVVYNELHLNSLDSSENSINFVGNTLYQSIYGDTTPAFNSGGSIEDLKNLTYEDVLNVYNTYYVPSNSMTYLAGKQDIKKTLTILDSFFKAFDRQEFRFEFPDTKTQPEEKVGEYNITADTKTVDIGFMTSGVPMTDNAKELYARDIIFNLIFEKMSGVNSKNYTFGGNTGGISNLALLVSEVPVEKKDEIIAEYENILIDFSENGFGELDATIDNYIAERNNPYFYAVELGIFQGILYHENPFYYTELSNAANNLKGNKELFDAVLKKYFTENPYSKIVVSGNTGVKAEENLQFGDAETERIKQETKEFQNWADAPDKPEVIATIPTLSVSDVDMNLELGNPIYEQTGNIDFYYTQKEEPDNAFVNLFFPVQLNRMDLNYLQLMTAFLSTQVANADLADIYIDLYAMENYHDSDQFNPQITIYLSGNGAEISENIEKLIVFLQEETTWDQAAFDEYVKAAPKQIKENGYRDPYNLSYELKQSKQTAGNAFYSYTRGSIGQGAVPYYHFLNDIKSEEHETILEKIKNMCNDMILESIPTVEYVGGTGYDGVKQTVLKLYSDKEKKGTGKVILPAGYHSAAIITNLTDANHFMLSGNIKETGYDYSGKMWVAGSILSSKYILPEMRGKYGAYGAGVSIDPSGLTSSVAGLSDIDLAIEVWSGMGDYLRNLNMTQKELEAVIVPVVKEFDEYYNDSDYGGILALSNKTKEDIKKFRDEMLSATVEDIKGYADFVDELVAQQKVYAVLSREAADNAKFDFAYYADAQTLKIYPHLTKNPKGYISGKSETEFSPDEALTRAEAAVLITRLTADKSSTDYNSVFSDVNTDDWYYDAVLTLADREILNGYEDGTFKPDKNITRAEFASVLAEFIFGEPGENKSEYADMTENDWFYSAMTKMTENGFITGYEGNKLYPNQDITRAEAVTIINRMVGKTYEENMQNPFADSKTHWAFEEITAAVN